MKAWRISELGHPSTALELKNIPVPEPGAGEVAIRVGAGTVNFADILLCRGVYQDRPGPPFTPGLETSGVIESVGPDVELPIGTRIAGMAALPAGGFAEHAVVRANSMLVFPEHVPFTDVTVLYSTYQTAHVALHHRGRLAADEWLLVQGGAGGVGSAAVQLGAAAGAKVIATAGSPEKLAFCREIGAHHVIDYRSEDLYSRVKETTAGHGVDVILDPVGGAAAVAARRLLAWEGRLLVVGFTSGDVPTYAANHILVKNYAVIGIQWSTYPKQRREVIESAHADLLRLYDEGAIRPAITQTIPLEGIPDALDALEHRRVIGRIVLAP
jgi:NADPH2:quinone reductase